MSYNTKVYRKQGGDELVVASGGEITIESGGTLSVESGAVLAVSDGALSAADIALADGKIFVGNAAGKAAAVTLQGDVTITNAGVASLALPKMVAANGGDTMTREENVAGLSSAITLANEIRGDFIAHAADERHTTGAQDTSAIPAAATDLTTLKTLAAALLTAYAAHNADMILDAEWAYHTAQGKACTLTSAVAPTTLAECITRLNDLKAKYNDHEDETTGHADGASVAANQVAATDADYGDTNRVPVAGVTTGDVVWWSILNGGTGNVTGVSATAGAGYIDFKFSADPQNDTIISYIVVRPAA
ncbi:MAG: hypothetical protein QM446_04620 [Synergistota bacterium]|nr:hypothetical protein [Synergistota bacterium]